jgi:hypothetical protein
MTSSDISREQVKESVGRITFSFRNRIDGTQLQSESVGAEQRHSAQLSNRPSPGQELEHFAVERDLLLNKYEYVSYAQTEQKEFEKATRNCYLFNIIIAYEWIPSYTELELFSNACDEFADLLFDLTDGFMTVGQFIIGGQELMGCADIQILASNRLHPRAWVNGLHVAEKYQPIRIGRGMWDKLANRLYPWHKQDGVSVLVHEWAHYALGLKDQYIGKEQHSGLTLALPQNSPVQNTLMASLRSTELLSTPPKGEEGTEWDALSINPEFAWLQIPINHEHQEIPPAQSPRPVLRTVGEAKKAPQRLLMRWDNDLGEHVDQDHCWIYVLKGSLAEPQQLIAQGVFEPHADGFPLLGADPNDIVIAVGTKQQPNGQWKESVAYATIESNGGGNLTLATFDDWKSATPELSPLVALRGDLAGERDGRPFYKVTWKISNDEYWQRHFFTIDGPDAVYDQNGCDTVFSLDGHLLLTAYAEDTDAWQLAIAAASIGGSPPSGFTGHNNPIPAGSADGNAMIFFNDPACGTLNNASYVPGMSQHAGHDRFEALRVVTTTNVHAGTITPAEPSLGPRSYTFAVTANKSFEQLQLEQFHPTLVLYVDNDTLTDAERGEQRHLKICRLNDGQWTPLTSYHDPDRYMVATSLNPTTAPGLYGGEGTELKPEYYRIFLMEDDATITA